MAKRITKCCEHCGSTNVVKDAYAVWDDEAQCWDLGDYYDSSACNDCGAEDCIIDKELVDEVQKPEN